MCILHSWFLNIQSRLVVQFRFRSIFFLKNMDNLKKSNNKTNLTVTL